MGMTVVVIGWLYLFGGRSGARQIVAASVVDRLVLVPAVLVSFNSRRLSSSALDVCDSRSGARHWRLGDRGLQIRSWSIKVGGPS
jgi:hypothetical protein